MGDTTGLKMFIVIGWLPIYRLVFVYINILSGVYLLAYVHMKVWYWYFKLFVT